MPGAPCEHLGGHWRASFAVILRDPPQVALDTLLFLSETGSLLSLEFAGQVL